MTVACRCWYADWDRAVWLDNFRSIPVQTVIPVEILKYMPRAAEVRTPNGSVIYVDRDRLFSSYEEAERHVVLEVLGGEP